MYNLYVIANLFIDRIVRDIYPRCYNLLIDLIVKSKKEKQRKIDCIKYDAE